MHLDKLPRYPLAQLPTPSAAPPALTRALGSPALLIKRRPPHRPYGTSEALVWTDTQHVQARYSPKSCRVSARNRVIRS